MSNPIVNIAFKRGWWNSIIDALRDAGPEYSPLATNLRNAVDSSTSPAAPLAKAAELPPITKATEIERGKQYLIQVDEGRPVPQEVAQRMLDKLNQRFPTNTFAIAGGCDVVEVGKASGSTRFATGGPVSSGRPFLKEAGERFIPMDSPPPAPPAANQYRRDELVGALRKVSRAFPPHTETHRVLTLLARELTNPTKASGYSYGRPVDLERDGVAPPPAATTGAATPAADESATGARTPEATPSPVRSMEIAWPLELDPDDRNGIARELEALGHSSGLTYWLDVAKAIRSIRPTPSPLCEKLHPWLPGIYCDRKPHGDKERHYAHPVDAPNPSGTVINWVSP